MTQELKPEEFTFEHRDEFERRPFAERLIQLILSEHDFFPLAITGQWGTGKTEFCKKTVHLINEQHNNTLIAEYLNAFSEDSYNDPLLSITSTICKTFIKDESRKGEYLKKFAKVLIPHLGASALKVFFPSLTTVIDGAKDAIVHNIENIQQNLENRSKIESSIKELKELVKEVSNGKPFVLFIDELDRCKPDFALHTLEVVKHIFDTENLKIIFVINKEQLVEIIKHSYGNNEEIAERYLDKFFQIHLKLPEYTKSNNEQIQNSVKYLDQEFSSKNIFNLPLFDEGPYFKTKRENSQVAHLLRELTEYYHLSLRDIEKLSKYLLVYFQISSSGNSKLIAFSLIEAYAIFHFTFNKTVFQNFKANLPALANCNGLKTSKSNTSSRVFARSLLHRFFYDPDDSRRYNYVGNSTVEDRLKFLNETLFKLDNLFLQ